MGHYSFAQRLRINLWAKHLNLKEDDVRIVNGIETEGSECAWFTADARKHVRLYDPGENKDTPITSDVLFPLGEPPGSRNRYELCVSSRRAGRGLLTLMQRESTER
jgi:hypothetical protein